MQRTHLPALAALIAIVGLAAGPLFAGDEFPPRTASGQTLVVADELLDAGEVYYVTPGEDSQIVCTSDAQLQRTAVTCSRVVGYLVAPFDLDAGKPPVLAGAFRLPAVALATGVRQYDRLLHGKAMLDVEQHPEIAARTVRVNSSARTAEERGRSSWQAELAIQLKIKDKTLDLTAPARLEFIPFTWRTMGRNVGELLILRTKLELKLADLGLEKPGREFADRVADTFALEVFLLCNTVSPERSNDPRWTDDQYCKHLQYLTLARDFQQPEQAAEFGRAYLREIEHAPTPLLTLAQAIVDGDGFAKQDLPLALAAARRASELPARPDPQPLKTVAEIYAAMERFDEAVRAQRAAIEAASSAPPEQVAELRATLQRYEAVAASPEPDSGASPPPTSQVSHPQQPR
ncbi:MAG: YceI family protein [Planctomycetota bacterium]